MRGSIFKGIKSLFVGLGLLTKPGIRMYVLIPLVINVLLFSLLIFFAYREFSGWASVVSDFLPDWEWLGFVDWLMWSIFYVIISVIVAFTFSIFANFIASPFNGFLAEAVQKHLTGADTSQKSRPFMAEIVHSLGREVRKITYYLPRLLVLFVLGFIPFITPIMPFVWLLFGAWMMSIQYIDYPMDNNRVGFSAMKAQLKEKRLTPLGYGLVTLGATMIPVVNLVVMPAAVAGATALWVKEYQPASTSRELV